MATTDTDEVRTALRAIVDRLIEEKPDVVSRFDGAFKGSAHTKDWLLHALDQQAEQLVAAADAVTDDRSPERRAAVEKLVTHVFTQAPVLALVPADVLSRWILDELG